MLKKTIKYTDFDGEEQTEIVNFNLTKSELKELQFQTEGGFGSHIQRAVEKGDLTVLFVEFKRLILMAYGERSEDGKRFVKTPEMAEAFTQTAAYDALFTEITEVDGAVQKFLMGILPEDISSSLDFAAIEGQVAKMPPPPAPEVVESTDG